MLNAFLALGQTSGGSCFKALMIRVLCMSSPLMGFDGAQSIAFSYSARC